MSGTAEQDFCPEAYYDSWNHLTEDGKCILCGLAITEEPRPADSPQKGRSALAIEVQEQVERILGRYLSLDGFDTAVAQVSRLVIEYAEGRQR